MTPEDPQPVRDPIAGVTAALPPGHTIGRYEIVRLLGAGGMGQVYLANDARLERLVALKCVDRRLASDSAERSLMLREARAAASLTHPGIAHVYDVIDHDGDIVIVMEHVAGTSLRERILSGPCGVDECLRLGAMVADALAHAHAAGLVHCDIKPANIQLLPDGAVKILDFGVARRVTARSGHDLAGGGDQDRHQRSGGAAGRRPRWTTLPGIRSSDVWRPIGRPEVLMSGRFLLRALALAGSLPIAACSAIPNAVVAVPKSPEKPLYQVDRLEQVQGGTLRYAFVNDQSRGTTAAEPAVCVADLKVQENAKPDSYSYSIYQDGVVKQDPVIVIRTK